MFASSDSNNLYYLNINLQSTKGLRTVNKASHVILISINFSYFGKPFEDKAEENEINMTSPKTTLH